MDDCLPADLLESFDVQLQMFYYEVLCQDVVDPTHVRHALREVTRAYRKETVDARASAIRFDTKAKRCAYVLKHSACFSSAVAKHLARWLRNEPRGSLMNALACRRRVELCCLGGGPATDAVGVAKVVNALNGKMRSASDLLLRVRVVDLSGEWRSTASHVMRALSKHLCHRVRVEFEFLHADLTRTWDAWLREVVGVADIVTSVYFVSAVNGSRASDRCLRMLQNIMDSLKEGALFFFLDSSKSIHLDTVLAAAASFDDIGVAYGPRPQSFHALSMASITCFLNLYRALFGANPSCLTHCFVACCGLVKGRHRTDDGAQVLRAGRRWRKWGHRNTRKAELYRECVERLILSEMGVACESVDDDCDTPLGPEWILFNSSKPKRKRIRQS